jgi:hypothetical protein
MLQAQGANELMFTRIRCIFDQLVAGTVPAHTVTLCKVGSSVHEGATFVLDSRAADLSSLSGGQRSLVSLCLVVAVCLAGGTGVGGLMLMDEVDGALDEANQRVVSWSGRVCRLVPRSAWREWG